MQQIFCIALVFFFAMLGAEKETNMEKSKAVLDLQQWFKDNGIRKGWFAEQLGVDGASLSRWLSGKVRPHAPARKLIEDKTGGTVKADSW